MGKAQPLYSKILTIDGWREMGTMQIGDMVAGSDGNFYPITGVFPQGKQDVYKMHFGDDTATECTLEHLWLTTSIRERETNASGSIRTLKTIRGSLFRGIKIHRPNHRIKCVEPINFPQIDLPIEPYLLGCYLGDGTFGSSVRLSNSSDELIDYLATLLPGNDEIRTVSTSSRERYFAHSRRGDHAEPTAFKKALEQLGLVGCRSYEKFIPPLYLTADAQSRMRLLSGLMDTDGSVRSKKGTSAEYSTSSYQLSLDVRELVLSLGGKVSSNTRFPWFTYKGERKQGRKSYRLGISFSRGINPFILERKASEFKGKKTTRADRKSIVSIEHVGKQECQCIAINSSDSLYVTDDYILTHNTVFSATAPKPLFLDCDGGLYSVREKNPDAWRIDSSKDLVEAYDYLKKGQHEYQTVVLDSITEIHRMLVDEHAGQILSKQTSSKQSSGYGMWNDVQRAMGRFLRYFRDLPMHTIYTALEIEEKDITGKRIFTPDLFGKMSARLAGYVDAVFYYTIQIKKDGNDDNVKTLRFLLTQPTDVIIAGYRKDPASKVQLERFEKPDFSVILQKMLGDTQIKKENKNAD